MDFCSLPLAGKLCDAADTIDFVTDPGAAITEGIGNWIAKSCGELAAAAADLAAEAVNTTTQVDLNTGWFRDNYELILPIGLVILVGTFCAQLVRAAIRRDGQALTQAFTGTATGVLFAFSAIALTTVAVEVVDALSDSLFRAANTSVDDAVRRMVKVSQIGALTSLGWLVPSFAAIGSAVGAVLYWCVMMVRKVGILVLVTLAVFAGAGGGWEVAKRWRRGWIEATATLVVSKLLMTIIFLLGISAMGRTEATDGIGALSDVMAGIVVMTLVLLCPYATFKFVHWAAEGTSGEELHRGAGAGMTVTRQHTERAGRKAAAMAATGGAGSGAGAGAAPQGPSFVPGQGPGGITAANPTNGADKGSRTSGNETANWPKEAVQPPPTGVGEGTGGQLGGTPAPTASTSQASGSSPAGPGSPDSPAARFWHVGTGPSPSPQGPADASSGSSTGSTSGPASPPPPPEGA